MWSSCIPELLLEINQYLSAPISQRVQIPDFATLYSCSLVCKAWAAPAQHLLFRRVILEQQSVFKFPTPSLIGRNHAVELFLEATNPEIEKGVWLANSVQSITFADALHSGANPSANVAEVLVRCRSLRELEIYTDTLAFDEATYAKFSLGGVTTLSLHTSPPSYTSSDKSATRRLLSSLAPSLQILDIVDPMGTAAAAPFPSPLNLRPKVLTIFTAYMDHLTPFLHSLLAPPSTEYPGPEVLSLRGIRTPADLASVIARHSTSLRSLHIAGLDPSDTATIEALAHCTRLAHVGITRDFGGVDALKALPHELQSLALPMGCYIVGFTMDPREGQVQFDAFLKELETFGGLKKLFWPVHESESESRRKALRGLCERRGIKLYEDTEPDNELEIAFRRDLLDD